MLRFGGTRLHCPAGCSQPAPEPGIITIAIPSRPTTSTRGYGTDENSSRAHQLLFNDLLRWTSRQRLAPGLAETWETADYQTYRIQAARRCALPRRPRADVGGRRLHVHEHSRSRVRVAAIGAHFATSPSVIAIDRYTVDFMLKQPSGSFLIESRLQDRAARSGTRACGSALSAPARTSSSVLCRRRPLELRAFRDYFDGLPRNRGIVLKIVPDDIMRGARAAERHGRSRRQRPPARHGVSARERRAVALEGSRRRLSVRRLQHARSDA